MQYAVFQDVIVVLSWVEYLEKFNNSRKYFPISRI